MNHLSLFAYLTYFQWVTADAMQTVRGKQSKEHQILLFSCVGVCSKMKAVSHRVDLIASSMNGVSCSDRNYGGILLATTVRLREICLTVGQRPCPVVLVLCGNTRFCDNFIDLLLTIWNYIAIMPASVATVLHYTVSQKKVWCWILTITQPNLNRFPKFLHC